MFLTSKGGCGVDDSTLFSAGVHLPALVKVNISQSRHVSDRGLLSFLQHAHALTSLNISWCVQLSDASLVHIRRLTELDMSHCWRLSSGCLHKIVLSCPRLKFVSVESCGQVTDENMLFMSKRLRSLTELNVSRCQNVTEGGVDAILSRCPLIKLVDAKKCAISADCVKRWQQMLTLVTH